MTHWVPELFLKLLRVESGEMLSVTKARINLSALSMPHDPVIYGRL
ncbi:MAG TPA: hypothetical protein VI728_12535 [Syntrophales bacterium]|nr:hypothetical protein [Syntrophales bacterium]